MQTPTPSWRLMIEEAPRSGAANMAVDEAIAEATATGAAPPTLRFYRWHLPTVSLGRHQKLADVDEEQIAVHGYDLVRRATGGRAILHTDELTYSVAGPTADPHMAGGVMDAYLRFSNGLLSGLKALGLTAEKASRRTRAARDLSAACFETPSAYEITAGDANSWAAPKAGAKATSCNMQPAPVWRYHAAGGCAGALTRGKRAAAPTAAPTGHHSGRCVGRAAGFGAAGLPRVAAAMAAGFASALNLALEPGPFSAGDCGAAPN